MNVYSWLILVALAAALGARLWLAMRQVRHIKQHKNHVPEAFAHKISLQAHQKAADYTVAKTHLSMAATLLGGVVLILWTFAGGLGMLDQLWRSTGWNTLYTGTALLLSFMLVNVIIELPVAIYSTFVVEEKYGFNKMSGKLFFTDTVKNIAVAAALGTPLILLVLWLMESAGAWWWLYAWLAWIGFNLLLVWIYPKFIAPLFNKFSPLEDEELQNRITRLLDRCGFSSNGIFVMDGSTRSGHGNAYFTGFGANKRIVFFDTLLASLNVNETEAVLAHELGHFKCHHIKKSIGLMAIMSLVGLALLGWLIEQPDFYTGLGVTTPADYLGLVLFILVAPLFTFFISPLFSAFSRKNEFEADAYAKQQSNAADLITALIKMYEENASTLTPDPLYSAFYDSHPPALARITRLQQET